MIKLIYFFLFLIVLISLVATPQQSTHAQITQDILAERTISLHKRNLNSQFVTEVMADNILLNLAYLNNEDINPKNVDWNKLREMKKVEFTLKPGEVFAYHNDALPQYQNFARSTNSHFNAIEGYKSDGYLYGDGVCHLASLMYWGARDAGLETYAPKDHNFAEIPEIPKEYGVAIYFSPGSKELNPNRNLYIKNTLEKPVTFVFTVENSNLKLDVLRDQ